MGDKKIIFSCEPYVLKVFEKLTKDVFEKWKNYKIQCRLQSCPKVQRFAFWRMPGLNLRQGIK